MYIIKVFGKGVSILNSRTGTHVSRVDFATYGGVVQAYSSGDLIIVQCRKGRTLPLRPSGTIIASH